jgi:hypothetical protein
MSVLQGILKFGLMTLMAIIRWWMCLTPLLIPPLFDTVHSCPHPHPYPYPEELGEEQEKDREYQGQLAQQQQRPQDGSSWSNWYGGDEKQRLHERDEAERAAVESGAEVTRMTDDNPSRGTKGVPDSNNRVNSSTPLTRGHESQEPPATSLMQSESAVITEEDTDKKPQKQGRFRFLRRSHASKQQRHEQGMQVPMTTATQSKKKKLSWWERRELKKKEKRRKTIIKASQDIGRFSLLFQLGSFFLLDRWGQSVIVGPGKKEQQQHLSGAAT